MFSDDEDAKKINNSVKLLLFVYTDEIILYFLNRNLK